MTNHTRPDPRICGIHFRAAMGGAVVGGVVGLTVGGWLSVTTGAAIGMTLAGIIAEIARPTRWTC